MHIYKKWHLSHLQSIPGSFWYSLAVAGAFLGIYGGWLLTQDVSQASPIPSDIAVALGAFASFVIAWIGVKRSHRKHSTDSAPLPMDRRLHFWVPLAFSIALLMQGVSSCIITIFDLSAASGPPILGMIVIMGRYPVLLVGIFLLPRDTLSGKVPLRFVMDSLMLIVALITFSWYFLLGPILFESQGLPIFAMAINTADITFDLLVISCLILLSRSLADKGLRTAIRGLSLALIIFVFTDSDLISQGLHGLPNTAWLSLGWMGANFAIALSLQGMRRLSSRTTNGATPHPSSLVATPLWRTLLTYMLVLVVIGLVFFLWVTDRTSILAIGTYSCSLLLLAVIFIRQIVVIREVHGFNQRFQHLQHILDEKNVTLEHANTRLDALATTDPLTELPNHRALISMLDQELVRCEQYEHKCSLLFFDLDHFKALNDTYGHAGGDTALREFGSLVRATLPPINTVGRWGGEEFVALLPEQDTTQACEIAEQLRSAVSRHSFSVGGGMHLTCSIGVASYPTHAQQPDALLQATDSAMYGAKRLGRNQVRVVDDPAVTALLATSSEVEGRDEAALIGMVHALALLVDQRDEQTGKHSQRVGELLLQLAQSLGFSAPEALQFSLVGQLHDIGKIVVADQILNKKEPLTESELASLRRHPQVGAEVVSCIPSLRHLAPIIYAHHEQWDGTGYPDQLAGEAIPFGARLLAVVDAYVVMIDGRFYQPAIPSHQALEELQHQAGTQFDPQAVEALTRLLQDTPEHRAEYESGIARSNILV